MPRPRKYPELGDISSEEYKILTERIRSNVNYSKKAIKNLEEKVQMYKDRIAPIIENE
jgi:hypothetical protein